MHKRPIEYATGLALGVLIVVAGCTIEVNVNTGAHEEEASPAAEAPVAPVPSVDPAPPPRVAPPTSAPVARPSAPWVRDALLRYREDADLTPPPPPAEEPSERPTFTPFTQAPSILNRSEVIAAMADEYPPLLREAGIGGTVILWFFIEEDGRVGTVRLHESSGHQALDEAALRVADVYRFSPALNRDQRVPVWVQFPITFQQGR